MFRSMRGRTTALFAVAAGVLMAASCLGMIFYARRAAEADAREVLRTARVRMAEELPDARGRETGRIDLKELREDLPSGQISLFLVTDGGKILQREGPPGPPSDLNDRQQWRTARVRLASGSLVLALPWSQTQRQLEALARALLALGAIATVVTTAGAWFVVGRTLSPIERLAREADSATMSGLSVQLRPPSDDAEMVRLVKTLNGLLERLSDSARAKGRFYSAASHELRTPLQALAGHLELALSKERTYARYREALAEADQQARRLIALTNGLLFLYQLESGASPPSETSDVAEICEDVAAELAPAAEERGMDLRLSLPSSAEVRAPATHAAVLTRNLIENAIRYGVEGSLVSVKVDNNGSGVSLYVENDAPLPEGWTPEALVEPFGRAEASRNRSTGGTGLGLAICRAIADANGWILKLEATERGVRASPGFHTSELSPPGGHSRSDVTFVRS